MTFARRYREDLDPLDFDTPEDFDAAQANLPPRPKTICRRCQRPFTWAEQRQQFGRLRRRGFSHDEAKALMPRCRHCVSIALGTTKTAPGSSRL